MPLVSAPSITRLVPVVKDEAGLARNTHTTAAFSYQAVPSFESFNRMAAVFALPLRTGIAGAGVFRFGDDLYNEHIVSLGFANTFGLASLGLKINYVQYRAEGFGTSTAFTASFGGIAKLTDVLLLGAHIININQPVINDLTQERIPTRLIAGIAYQPSEKLFVTAEVEKDLEHAAFLKAGFEYWLYKKIAFRTGFNLNPDTGFFGTGYKVRKFDLDYALQFSTALGLSHQATVSCKFNAP